MSGHIHKLYITQKYLTKATIDFAQNSTTTKYAISTAYLHKINVYLKLTQHKKKKGPKMLDTGIAARKFKRN